ncbi:MAG: hypothetical protein DDT28_00337 [Dehalococcoidia bacterium]|nr:hypothetical protein [Chloroflexota bacterium]
MKVSRNAPCACGSGRKYKHCCMRKDAQKLGSTSQVQVLEAGEVSITKEASYIISQAENYDARLVTLGPLIFFSTETGDAWMLDPEDELALCLARDGDKEPFTITETPTNFSIEWNASYRIDADAFIVIERSGRIKTVLGYPTTEILQATHRAKQFP